MRHLRPRLAAAHAWLADGDNHRWLAAIAIGVSATFLVWSRFVGLDQGLWVDEIQSRVRWSSKGPGAFYDKYNENNHVLYNMLTWALTDLAHSSNEALIRFWSAFAGVCSVAIMGVWSWRRFGPLACALLVFLLVVSPVHMEHTRDARGWGFLFLPTALLVVFSDRLLRKGDRTSLIGIGVAGFLGIATLPIFGLPFVGTLLALFLRPELRRKVLIAGGATLLLAALFYAPVAPKLLKRVDRFVAPTQSAEYNKQRAQTQGGGDARVPLPAGLETLKEKGQPRLTLADAPGEFMHDVLSPTIEMVTTGDVDQLKACQYKCYPGSKGVGYALAGAVVLGLGLWALWRRRETGLLLVLTVPIALMYLALGLINAMFFLRFGSFFLIHAMVLVTVGVVELARVARRVRGGPAVVVGATLLVSLAMLASAGHVAATWIAAPKESFKELGRIINGSGIERVVTNSRRTTDLDYYVEPEVDRLSPEELDRFLCTYRGELVFIDHPFFAPSSRRTCLQQTGAVRIELPQRKRGAKMIVWLRGPIGG